ncbi:MAG: tetratricopeptide repeat protein [Candidatus Wallbacteria bacterium]|nr:tetratricopeptide repeat protein [Candidatus Wallbacteria bacterium]
MGKIRIAVLAAFLIMLTAAYADTLFLKNGVILHGKVKELSDNTVYLASPEGEQVKIKEDKIESLVFSEHSTGIFEGSYRNFKFKIAFPMPADFWYLKEGDLKDNLLITLSKEKDIREDATLIKMYVIEMLPEEYPDLRQYPKNEKQMVQTSEKILKGLLPDDTARITKEMYQNSSEVLFFKQMTTYTKKMVFGNELLFKQINLVTFAQNKAFVILYDASELNYDRDLPYFTKTAGEFEFIGEYPIYDVFNNLGNIYFYDQKYKESLRYFEAAMKEKVDPDILNKVGIIYSKLGDFRKAREFFEQALKMMPVDAKVKFNMENTGEKHYSGFGVDGK